MNEQISEVEHLFMAFADKTRLQLLYLLRDGEMGVNALSGALNTSQPKVSRHLAYLRTMNVVTTRREGKSIFYKLNIPANSCGASIVEETIDWIDALTGASPSPKRPKTEPPRATLIRVMQSSLENTVPNQPEVFDEPEAQHIEREMEVYLL